MHERPAPDVSGAADRAKSCTVATPRAEPSRREERKSRSARRQTDTPSEGDAQACPDLLSVPRSRHAGSKPRGIGSLGHVAWKPRASNDGSPCPDGALSRALDLALPLGVHVGQVGSWATLAGHAVVTRGMTRHHAACGVAPENSNGTGSRRNLTSPRLRGRPLRPRQTRWRSHTCRPCGRGFRVSARLRSRQIAPRRVAHSPSISGRSGFD